MNPPPRVEIKRGRYAEKEEQEERNPANPDADAGGLLHGRRGAALRRLGDADGAGAVVARGGAVGLVKQNRRSVFRGERQGRAAEGFHGGEIAREGVPVLRPVGGGFCGHFAEQLGEGDGDRSVHRHRVGEEVVGLSFEELFGGVPVEGGDAGGEVVECEAQGVDVACDALGFAGEDFGGDVGRRTFERGEGGGGDGGHAGEAEIHDAEGPVAREHEVAGFDVAVEEAELGEDFSEHVGGDPSDFDDFLWGEGSGFDDFGKGSAVDKFHRVVEGAVRFAGVDDGGDGGMADLGGELGFAAEGGAGGVVEGEIGGKDLEGDGPVKGKLLGVIDDGGTAGADDPDDSVAGDGGECRFAVSGGRGGGGGVGGVAHADNLLNPLPAGQETMRLGKGLAGKTAPSAAPRVGLPSIGKNDSILPNIGKMHFARGG